jgi:prepilin-type N-terminal cleavage/methylation domain-containing protein
MVERIHGRHTLNRAAAPLGRTPARGLRPAFTLIEILVTMTILVILAALIAGAAVYAVSRAKQNSTQVVLNELHGALAVRWDKFLQDTQSSMPIDRYKVFAGAASVDSIEANSILGKRAAVLARIDAMRSAFPQSFGEIVPSKALANAITASANPTLLASAVENAANTAFGANQNKLGFAAAPLINAYPTHHSILYRYLVATRQIESQVDYQAKGGLQWAGEHAVTNPPNHDPETESSECLYLILSDTAMGENVLESIPSQFIKDTDGDGLMEFVDGWGRPIKFYRWPTDLWAHFIEVTRQVPSSMMDNSLDNEDLLYGGWFADASNVRAAFETLYARLHLAYYPTRQPMPPFPGVNPLTGANGTSAFANTPREYPFQPILVSAGPDGEFGLYRRDTVPNGLTSPPDRPETFLPLRCGRVEEDPTRRPYVNDNLYSIDLREASKQ